MSDNRSSARKQDVEKYFFRASAVDFRSIPDSPIAYWLTHRFVSSFEAFPKLGDILSTREGLTTGSNATFLRLWFEVPTSKTSLPSNVRKNAKWQAYLKGGEYRRWAGNNEYLVDWEKDGEGILNFIDQKTGRVRSHNYNGEWAFKPGITWSSVSGEGFSVRNVAGGYMFDTTGSMGFVDPDSDRLGVVAYLNSVVASEYMKVLSPAIRFQPGHALNLPYNKAPTSAASAISARNISISQCDWDSYETSWDFTSLPLLHPDYCQPTLKTSYQKLRAHWREMTLEMQHLEQENNRIFIDAYGLQDEFDEKVDLSEVTLTCNPYYRYGGDESEEELEAMLLADTIRELISYAVGCMFGRYSLDKPGLILANQGETLADYLAQVPQPTFPADDDNVIPLLDGDWFPDDITLRFRQFLRSAFGDKHYEDNLAFIEQALNVKGKRNFSLRDYFLGEFYVDHVKRYKKRPIYWLFSSPKGTFSALVYLHRYRPDTVSVVLSYLRDFRKKLASRLDYLQQVAISTSASPSEKTKAIKEAEVVKKQLLELDDYERDTLYPLATEQVELNLDDGVKVNYLKLGAALKKIPGLEAKGED
ncbi:BREX-1 system adenine-specific DNA-methyltransferase PglX [Pseudomonas aeruginosa]|uniref:BREX-1 system adenine-specific DNA-methyltransferase PglX n=1 Tax=Pseudomonas aeruginosa TaxID=287 RepID=UPI0018C6A5A8|nr:BREX-1 system adenine-specific DNA-methyltransferase PglX [Pseudomonas aeruginosa]MDP5858742.1 BREX-1 system adenine-specific DNA-methyltransferase PglX [Pseudomonas aeruginosa]